VHLLLALIFYILNSINMLAKIINFFREVKENLLISPEIVFYTLYRISLVMLSLVVYFILLAVVLIGVYHTLIFVIANA